MVLMQEGARYHPSAETKAFFARQAPRLQVVQWPTYAPDDHPIEQLWKKSKQPATPLHYFPTVEALPEKGEQALSTCAHLPEEILALCSRPAALAQAA
jgi:transposase